jgi:hypothetical protein
MRHLPLCIISVAALAFVSAGCANHLAAAAQTAASKAAPQAGKGDLVVSLAPCSLTRLGDIQISQDANGQMHVEDAQTQDLVKGEVQFGKDHVAVYVPAHGPYPLTSKSTDSFENTSTALSIDANSNGSLEGNERWFSSFPVRLGDQMMEVKEIDPGGKWILFHESSSPLVAVVGKPCPDFQFTTMGGERVSLSDYKGKALLLDVWSMT